MFVSTIEDCYGHLVVDTSGQYLLDVARIEVMYRCKKRSYTFYGNIIQQYIQWFRTMVDYSIGVGSKFSIGTEIGEFICERVPYIEVGFDMLCDHRDRTSVARA